MCEQIQPFVKPVVSAELLLACIFAEHEYWRAIDDREDAEAEEARKYGINIGATSALANVIAFATIEGHRAEWHPEKPAPENEVYAQPGEALAQTLEARIETLEVALRDVARWLLKPKYAVSSTAEITFDWDSRNTLYKQVYDLIKGKQWIGPLFGGVFDGPDDAEREQEGEEG